MPRTRSNGIEIEYETFGDEEPAPLLLVAGLGAQMVVWDEAVCEGLAERGRYGFASTIGMSVCPRG